MASNLGCVGLAVADGAELGALVAAVLPDSALLGRAGDIEVRRWEDPSGARLVLGLRHGEVEDLLPSFASATGGDLQGLGFDGDLARAGVVEASGTVVTQMSLHLEQHRLLDAAGTPVARPVRITALGVDVAVFDDADVFRASPTGSGARMAAESFIPTGDFAAPGEATAHAVLAGTVRSAGVRTVARTGQRFVAAQVVSYGFAATVCFPADQVERPPQSGNVIFGTVFLVGSLDSTPGGV